MVVVVDLRVWVVVVDGDNREEIIYYHYKKRGL